MTILFEQLISEDLGEFVRQMRKTINCDFLIKNNASEGAKNQFGLYFDDEIYIHNELDAKTLYCVISRYPKLKDLKDFLILNEIITPCTDPECDKIKSQADALNFQVQTRFLTNTIIYSFRDIFKNERAKK